MYRSEALKKTRSTLFAACLLGLGVAAAALPAAAQATAKFTSEQLQTRMLERRAVEAALWGMPLVNFDAMRQAYFRDAGAKYNDVMFWSRPSDWKNQTTTPNHSTIYVMFFVNLKDGPVVVDIPATKDAGLYGTLIDSWTVPMMNVGDAGEDKGKGGRYVLLPPGYKGETPAGYVPVQSKTFNNYSLLRVITKTTSDKDLAGGVDYLKALKIYPLANAAAPEANRYIDVADKVYDGIARYDASYYESLARMVAEEPVQQRDLVMVGQMRSLGIGKSIEFKPDAQHKAILERSIGEAHAYMMDGYAKTGRAIWGDKRKWRSLADPQAAMDTKMTFDSPEQGVYLDERAYSWFAMFGPIVPPGPHVYMKSYETGKGEALDGGHTYRLTIPADAPARDFWSVDAYDSATGGFIREAKVVGLDSYNQKLKANADGTVDLYFGPKPPAGKESNWISTKAGQQFFTLFRIYGPDRDKLKAGWVLNDIEKIK
ncbi:DUF1254 domain-containing protein [Pseudomonas schmalbachii]|uniref:DUF1254 domain-containing protein n=1 Tax=Pseudomonas schmalbachii TaxID=2816993 RepID=A0ABS3TPQ8_9PSED|nr:DUF1254 domain-containing protein [Pseudomonas schmalbachii]MBO3275645.1 DUF1254 domain-containing protein [Pseudomonas schmalbachii]